MTNAELRTALARARNDLLAYGFHLDGEWINRGGDPETHRLPGEPCRCGLDAAIARASAALGDKPQSFREAQALGDGGRREARFASRRNAL